MLAGVVAAPNPALAVAPPEYYPDTKEVIAITRAIINGTDSSPEKIAEFQTVCADTNAREEKNCDLN